MQKSDDEEEWPERRGSADNDDTFLFEREFDEADGVKEEVIEKRGMGSWKGNCWVVLMVLATVAGRRILRGGFREF